MNRIFLIGYMGTGKTTAGRHLARLLNLSFYDLDNFIESRYLKSITQIFAELGEEKFREIEKSVLQEVGEFEDVVIATGGGAPCFFDNMNYMNEKGTTIYLKASPKALANRLINLKAKRPLLKDKTDDQLLTFVSNSLAQREPFYSKAKIIFETENFTKKSQVDEYVQKLIKLL